MISSNPLLRSVLAVYSLLAMCAVVSREGHAQSIPLVSPAAGDPLPASAITVHLLALARPTVAVLQRASLLAETRARAKPLRAFARREDQILPAIGEALDVAAAPTPVGRDPLDVAAVAAASLGVGADTILSALPRIVRTPGARAISADRAIAERGAADLERLATLTGTDFDALYGEISRRDSARLLAVFDDYVRYGDDPDLRATCVHALPALRAQFNAITARVGQSYADRPGD